MSCAEILDFKSLENYFVLGGMTLSLAGLLCCFWRMLHAQLRADLVIGMDVLTLQVLCLIAGIALFEANASYLDIILVISLIGFITTIALAHRFLSKRQNKRKEEQNHDPSQ